MSKRRSKVGVPDLNKSFLQYIAILNSGSFSWLNSAPVFLLNHPTSKMHSHLPMQRRARRVCSVLSRCCVLAGMQIWKGAFHDSSIFKALFKMPSSCGSAEGGIAFILRSCLSPPLFHCRRCQAGKGSHLLKKRAFSSGTFPRPCLSPFK